MKSRSKILISIGFLFISLFVSGALRYAAYSQDIAIDKGVTVSPVRYEFIGEPGEIFTGQVKYYNNTSEDKTLYLRTQNFEPMDETGNPRFIEDEMPFNSSLMDWIALDTYEIFVENIDEEQAKPTIINFTLEIPSDATPGGHYAGIIQSSKPPNTDTTDQESTGPVVVPESACIILVTVAGDVNAEGSSKEFWVTDPFKKEQDSQKIYEYFPTKFISRIKNSGNVHFKPQGNIMVYRGETLVGTLPFNEEEGNILRESIRRFESESWGEDVFFFYRVEKTEDGEVVTDEDGNTKTKLKFDFSNWKKIPIGKFEAKLVAVYDGEGGKKVINDSVTFWVIPWKLILLMFVILFIIAMIVLNRSKNKATKKGKKKAVSKE